MTLRSDFLLWLIDKLFDGLFEQRDPLLLVGEPLLLVFLPQQGRGEGLLKGGQGLQDLRTHHPEPLGLQ